MDKHLILRYLDCRRFPLAQDNEATRTHNALCESEPEFYLHLLSDPGAHISHKREIMVNLLLQDSAREVAKRQRVLAMLNVIPIVQALQVIGVIHDLRINRSRAHELVLSYLLGHKELPELAAIKRQRLGQLLRHVLGERTWSSMRRLLANPTPEGEQFLQREVLRYAWNGDEQRLREVLCFLAGVPFEATLPVLVKSLAARRNLQQGEGLPLETLTGLRGNFHSDTPLKRVRRLAAPAPTTRQGDGAITAAYKEAFTKVNGEQQAEDAHATLRRLVNEIKQQLGNVVSAHKELQLDEEQMIDGALKQEAEQLPKLEGKLAVVLDLSASMASSGERSNHPAALGLALTRLLRECVSEVRLFQVGGTASLEGGNLPLPQGNADLALALLEAVRNQPQLILIITDGYENLRQGDTALIVEGLRRLKQDMPIYQVVTLFSNAENLVLRQLGEQIPLIPVLREEHICELLARVLLTSAGEQLTAHELQQLQQLLTKR